MDKEFREALMQLRFNYKHKIGRGLKTYAEYKTERRRILKESRQKDALFYLDAFDKWMDKKKTSIKNRSFYKKLYEDALKKIRPQSKLDIFISQKD